MNRTITSTNKLLHLWQSLFDDVCNVLDFAIRNVNPCLVTEFFVVVVVLLHPFTLLTFEKEVSFK
jgi:hypothetical protein